MGCVTDSSLTATPLHARLLFTADVEPSVVRVTTKVDEFRSPTRALIVKTCDRPLPPGYGAYLSFTPSESVSPPIYAMPPELSYLEDGDVIRINPRRGHVWVMYRRRSPSNSLLVTERCNSWCVMCSQPPKASEDESLVQAWLEAIPLIDPSTEQLGFTGGEPTLLGDLFLKLVSACRDHLPATGLHVLSNGRLFNYLSLAQELRAIGHPDVVVGVPLYSDIAWQHDFIVQAPHAFDQTIRGLLNLARCNIATEIRVVIHRYSVDRLPQLAAFIARNLAFAQHVALMGLEPIGFAKTNAAALWVDPADYHRPLADAVGTLVQRGMNVSIYNHQLCVTPPELWGFCRQSISDWKNIFLPECHDCAVREQCGGFFHSAALLHSRAIHPIEASGVITSG